MKNMELLDFLAAYEGIRYLMCDEGGEQLALLYDTVREFQEEEDFVLPIMKRCRDLFLQFVDVMEEEELEQYEDILKFEGIWDEIMSEVQPKEFLFREIILTQNKDETLTLNVDGQVTTFKKDKPELFLLRDTIVKKITDTRDSYPELIE